jgi:uncharacterized membrane protein YphA (DoxX/SURF4 family)
MVMQRLFSSFPNSWPGIGLLLLRVSIATVISLHGLSEWTSGAGVATVVATVSWISGVLLLVGTWTPYVGPLAAINQALIWSRGPDEPLLHVLCIGSALSLALIGPGAWSVDAYIYGRKRVL